jgi:hypothetical protein
LGPAPPPEEDAVTAERAEEPAATSSAPEGGEVSAEDMWDQGSDEAAPTAIEGAGAESLDAAPDPGGSAEESFENEHGGTMESSPEVDAPPISPVDLDEGRPPIDIHAPDDAEPQDIESVAARRGRRDRGSSLRWPLSRLPTLILALLIADGMLIGMRGMVVRIAPQTASLYAMIGMPVNLRGLTFDSVATSAEQHEGVPILVVDGNVVNPSRRAIDVPRLKFVIRNAARQEIYSWTAVPSRSPLPPGEAVAFRSRLASPPPEARDVLVRFVNRRDVIAAR